MKIGIIGCGFVGSAILSAYIKNNIPCVIRDPDKGFDSSLEEIKTCDAVFVCVPSPQKENGECDTSILEEVIERDLSDYRGIIISKVTAPPYTYEWLERYCNTGFVYAPEFLTAANSVRDYAASTFVIVGGKEEVCTKATDIICKSLTAPIKTYQCSIKEASMIKYTINSFLATKVIFMNEIENLCSAIGVNYKAVSNALVLDERIGSSHLQVPGPDGHYGFGGACFPKDTSALFNIGKEQGVDLDLLQAAIEKNNKIRGVA
jgi:UDPglucose 6-dehydrogenase